MFTINVRKNLQNNYIGRRKIEKQIFIPTTLCINKFFLEIVIFILFFKKLVVGQVCKNTFLIYVKIPLSSLTLILLNTKTQKKNAFTN